MPDGDIYEMTIHCQHIDQRGIIRRYYRQLTTVGNGPTPGQIAARFDVMFGAPIKSLMGNGADYLGVKIAKVSPLPRTIGTIGTVGTGPGIAGADMLPRQVRGIITLLTAFAGVGYRGRSYVPFPAEQDNGPDGKPVAGYVANLNILATQLVAQSGVVGAGGNTAVFQPILWHGNYDDEGVLINRTPIDLTTFISRQRWATQRRSGDYGRTNPAEIA